MAYNYFSPPQLVERRGYGPSPTGLAGVLDTIGSFVKDGFSAAVDVVKSSQQQAGAAAAYKDIASQQAALAAQRQAGMPSWILPVALVGGAGLIALVVLKGGKRKNPAKRPRKHRAHRRRHHARRRRR